MKPPLRSALASVVVLSLTVLAVPSAMATANDSDPNLVTLNIYNFSDIHGHIEQVKDKKTGKIKEAGAAAITCWVNKKRKENPNSALVILADTIGASPYTSGVLYDNPTIDALNRMKPLLSTLGNHELDMGLGEFEKRVAGGKILDTDQDYVKPDFPYMAANVTGDTTAIEKPGYKIWDSPSGVKVAVIATIAQDTPAKLAPGSFGNLVFNDPAEKTNELAKQLKESGKADIVIGAIDDDAKVMASKMNKYVDGIMGGDTHLVHNLTNTPGSEGNTLTAVQSGEYGDYMANIQLTYNTKTKKVASSKGEIIPASKVAECGEDPDVAKLVKTATSNAQEAGKRPVAQNVTGDYKRGVLTTSQGVSETGSNRGTESTAGAMIADSLRSYNTMDGKQPDISMIAAGGIRADIIPTDGVITYAQTFTATPFGNEVGYVHLSGAELIKVLNEQWKEETGEGSRPMLKLNLSSNVSYTYDWTLPQGEKITTLMIDGKPVVAEDQYTVSAPDFLLVGGDSFNTFKGKAITRPDVIDRDLLNQYLSKNGSTVTPRSMKSSVGVHAPKEFTVVTPEVFQQCRTRVPSGINQPQTSLNVELRGLSFTEGPGISTKIKASLGDITSQESSVDNLLTDYPVVATDGAGQATVTLDLKTLKSGTYPLVITSDRGELVSAKARQNLKVNVVSCPTGNIPTGDDTSSGGGSTTNDDTTLPTIPIAEIKKSPSAPATPTTEIKNSPSTPPTPASESNTAAPTNGKLARTGADLSILPWVTAAVLTSAGALTILTRRRHAQQ